MQFRHGEKIKALSTVVWMRGLGEASKCLSRDLGITLEEMVEVAGVRGQYLVVKFPWACGRAPRSSHDGFRPYDEETEKSGFLVF